MLKKIFSLVLAFNFVVGLNAQQTIVQYLSGKDKDHTVNWDFYCTKGRNSGKWTTIPVPSNWEMQGFGNYAYYKDNNDPEQGLYKHQFKVPSTKKGKKIVIVFEAAMTDAEVKINGQSAGPIHQGGFYEFKYDITDLVQFDKVNLLEVTVSRHSTNESINRAERKADFWLFGGIFRPVYLEIFPETNIQRVAINAQANGDFSVNIFANNSNKKQIVEAQIQDLKGNIIDKSFSLEANDSNTLNHHFNNIKTWNPEQPNLYNAIFSIKENGKIIHTIKQRFGFRTTEMRLHDGFYVNGVKVIFKGVCRHSEWPESGRTLSREIHLKDIGLMKEMNMNAVRMSHYPPNKEFLDLCDSLGLFVLDELTGWQASYDTTVGKKLVKELVVRDVNHPSIVLWDNGNEGGWNRALDNDYQLYDPQKRWVIHPWERFNGTNTKHYPDFKYVQNEVATGKDVFFPTEFMHGLFDGGHGAALEDFWNEMMKHPNAAGGFLWSLHDEGIVRSDRHDSIDVAGNQAPDGIVGPHREKEGSFYAIKEIWSPVQIPLKILPENFDGKLPIENRYLYTNLDKCRFEWKLVKFPNAAQKITTASIISKGTVAKFSLLPNDKGTLNLNIDKAFSNADALYVTAYDAYNKEIFTWSWAIASPKLIAEKAVIISRNEAAISTKNEAETYNITCDNITYTFNKATGFLQKVFNGISDISINNGPSLAGISLKLLELKTYQQGDAYIVEPIYKEDDNFTHYTFKWMFKKGQLPQLDYFYNINKETDYTGITFNYPEEKITGMQWLGRGPYHVWKNRLPGLQLGVWQKDYNNTITGENWKYPEFKGWHSQVYWATIQSKECNFTIYTNNENMYFQMLQPAKPKAAGNNHTSPPFPGNTIGFFNAISPIGTKFNDAKVMGPQSQKNEAMKTP
ncbi:MAG: glycoside hydrolase family 2, partial [Pedobacter sp.]|nr:glycoside hydrolase family 2 [Chitinophagaceae bacterium]